MSRREAKRPRPNQQGAVAAASTAVVRQDAAANKDSLLLALSTSCQNHQSNHHSKKKDLALVSWYDNEAQVPEFCRKSAIESLRNILPKVEKQYRPPAAGEKGPAAREVGHLCDFYISALGGVFCPHAPHLFLLGKGGTEILPRAHALFQHLASRTVIGNTVATAAARREPGAAPPRPFSATIASTIGKLLAFVPEPVLQRSILKDLVYLLGDLSAISGSGLLETATGPVEVDLFCETLQANRSLDDGTDYSLGIPNTEALLSLQGATLSVLETFVTTQKKVCMESPPDDGRLLETDPYALPTQNDLFLGGVTSDAESLDDLVSVLRQVLLSATPPDRKLRVLSLRAKENAARILSMLHQDYQRTGVTSFDHLSELARLVANAILGYLRLVRDHEVVDTDCGTSYASILVSLVDGLILFPPRVQESSAHHNAEMAVSGAVLPLLVTCVEFIHSKPLQIDDSGQVLNDGVALEAVLLRALHVLARKMDLSASKSPFASSLSHQSVEKLFDFLGDHSLSDGPVWILSFVLRPQSADASCLASVDSVCRSCLDHEQDQTMADVSKVPAPHAASDNPPAVTGRGKRSRTIMSPLKIEASPKRRKVDSRGGYELAPRQTRYVTASSVNAVFAKFLLGALASAQGLVRLLEDGSVLALLNGQEMDPSRVAVLLKANEHAVTVSSGVQLLATILKNSASQGACTDCAGTLRVLALLLQPLSKLYGSVVASRGQDAVSPPALVRLLIETGVKCGAVVSYLSPLLPPNDTESGWRSPLESLSRSPKALFALLESTENLSDPLPVFLSGVAVNCAVDARFSAKQSDTVSLFDRFVVSLQMGTVNGSALPFLSVAAVLAPLTSDNATQQQRLELLAQKLHMLLSGGGMSLQEATMRLMNAPHQTDDHGVRLCKWQAIAWLFLATEPAQLRRLINCTDLGADARPLDSTVGGKAMKWLLEVAFSDPNDMVRDYASKEIGQVLSANNNAGVLAVLSRDEEWRSLLNSTEVGNADRRRVAEQVLARLFQEVDRLLHEYCRVPQSQLSFTVRTSSASTNLNSASSAETIVSFQRSAIRALVGMCEGVEIESPCGRVLFEQSLGRIVRLWSGLDSGKRLESAGLGYGELSCLARRAGIGEKVREHCVESFVPGLFQDILVPSSGFSLRAAQGGIESIPPEVRERQYRLLLSFIQRFVIDRDGSTGELLNSAFDFLELCLPFVLAQLVVEKDYDALRLTTGFKLFLQSLIRSEEKTTKREGTSALQRDTQSDLVLAPSNSSQSRTSAWTRRLEDQTRNLMLAPQMVERMLPSIFMRAGRSELVFFIKVALQNRMTLKAILTLREQLILKGLVWELGRDPDLLELAKHAIRTAASARSEEPVSLTPGEDGKSASIGRSWRDSSHEGHASAAAKWVSGHFLYLLVNRVQFRWVSRSPNERLQAVRCLFSMLDFLLPPDSPQYVPQIMATVNAAIGQERNQRETSRDQDLLIQLRLLAVQVLAKFVKLVADYQWETVGQNLTSIVVSLIPVLSEEERSVRRTGDGNAVGGPSAVAVELLEWLTQSDLGRNLATFFKDIPFLPSSPALSKVRSSLRALGVDFDDLQITSTQVTQQDGSYRDSVQGGSMSTDTRPSVSSSRRQGALKNRIEMICSLLGNENASIRRVVLHHLTALLRANRELYHVLVENEGSTSMRQYVTVSYPGTSGFSRGTVTGMVDVLLSCCVRETDEEARILLATCLGEVGAICENRLEDTKAATNAADSKNDAFCWRLSKPPWQSRPNRYELRLVTKYLVIALKAAPTSGDQHKIAYTIQQLLVLLDVSANESKPTSSAVRKTVNDNAGSAPERPAMNSWLASKLSEAQVLDVVEPFWFSAFAEAEAFAPKQPPFFRTSSNYYQWISSWSRYMVQRSYETRRTKWSELFYACRTALRTQAGLSVAEFLLPILVLDRICFGDGPDEQAVVQEMKDVLTFDESGGAGEGLMAPSERQKAVSALFMIIDTLQFWTEQETEQRHKKSGQGRPRSNSRGESNASSAQFAGDEWPLDESIMRIDDILQAVPLSLRADAAARVGMHARALRLLEMATRARGVDTIFNGNPVEKGAEIIVNSNKSRAVGAFSATDMNLTKDVMASLNDYETMAALEEDSFLVDPTTRVRDSIRQKEAIGDWEGALQDYEQAQQLDGPDRRNPSIQRGALGCMLRLGRLESVLTQVDGIMSTKVTAEELNTANAIPVAVEASWRLGRWESLSNLVDIDADGLSTGDSDATYQVSLGHAMLGLHTKDLDCVNSNLASARGALMDGLSSVAGESYSRAYGHIVRLQSLREIEDAAELVCSDEPTPNLGDWVGLDAGCAWDRRLDFMSPSGATTVINTRLALSRLRGDSAFEGSLFLKMGKRARKDGLYTIAMNAFTQAEVAFDSLGKDAGLNDFSSTLRMQVAKLKHDTGESSIALRMLGQDDVERMADIDEPSLRLAVINYGKRTRRVSLGNDDSKSVEDYVQSALQSTRWMVHGGLKGGNEIMGRFRVIHRLAPKWEKSHFQFAKYVDSMMQSRIMALQRRSSEHFVGADEDAVRSRTISQDKTCQKQALLAIKHYAEALSIDLKHVYLALPRLLSLWFDFTSIEKIVSAPTPALASQVNNKELADAAASLSRIQDEANAFMAKKFKQIPAQAFYTAMPQLISRITHDDKETALVVRGILRRVLTKFPAQAMWPLAWLRQSRDAERLKIGDSLFHEAERALMKGPNERQFKLLVASKSLFKFFQDLAKYPIKDTSVHIINIKPWKGEVALTEFIPPIQAALSVSMPTQDNGRSRDLFPRQVPRMRAFHIKVTVMSSKARPKKLRALVVGADSRERPRHSKSMEDIGEIHFLVKQEAKGDLRKDARVQDLNNVINRLMAGSNGPTSRKSRQLHLRTFAVTCLSEDTGLLEWVPETESLRSLVCNSYNPQASPFSSKRRGRRLANFGDPMLRNNFEKKCQEMYFKTGDLKKAAALFDQLCLKPYPPLLYWWFVQKYHDPHAWYEARTRFTLSAAAWSAVGHVIGLGDRHSDNILVDTTNGECVHVDFDCIFDKGLNLPKPEVVPFRLTQNMLDAFGPAGADGIFTGSLQAAMSVLRDNRETLLSVLEPFLKDPVIDWKRYRSQQKSKGSTQDRQTKEAKRSINVIDERLKGIYNLRNPNLKKIRRTDGLAMDQQDDEHSQLPLSVEGQAHKMIAEATSIENLVQLYVGWMPWV